MVFFLLGLLAGLAGGGGNETVSKNTLDVVNNTINDISVTIEKNCKISSDTSQTIDLKIKSIQNCTNVSMGNLSQSINSSGKLDCKTSNISSVELTSILKNNLSQFSESTKSGLFSGFGNTTRADNEAYINNLVTNKTAMTDIANAINEGINKQYAKIEIENVTCPVQKNIDIFGNVTYIPTSFNINNIDQYIINEQVAKALLSSETYIKTLTDIDNNIKQEAKASLEGMTGFEFIGIIIAIAICVIIGLIIYRYAGKNQDKSTGQSTDQSTDQSVFSIWLIIFFMIVCTIVLINLIMFGIYTSKINQGNGSEDNQVSLNVDNLMDENNNTNFVADGADITTDVTTENESNTITDSTTDYNNVDSNADYKFDNTVNIALISIVLFLFLFTICLILYYYIKYDPKYKDNKLIWWMMILCALACSGLSIGSIALIAIDLTRLVNYYKSFVDPPEL